MKFQKYLETKTERKIILLMAVVVTCLTVALVACVTQTAKLIGEISILSVKIEEIERNATNSTLEEENTVKTAIEQPRTMLLKNVKLTAYCKEPYKHRCNNGDFENTATMTVPTAGRTIAVDPKVIPHGASVTINGKTYIAEDSGGWVKGNRIDILFETHQEAIEFGVQHADVIVEV